jgi:Bacterial mobilisation protein (MobC)
MSRLGGPPERLNGWSRRGRVAALGTAAGPVNGGAGSRPLGRTRRQRQAQPRSAEQKVMLSIEEQRRLRVRASELRVSVPRLMVEAALSDVETPADRRAWIAELFELRRLLATVANNVNQLTKAANISGDLPAGERLARTLADVDQMLLELREWTGARR